ncbi:unnamed protein product [Leptidea sinapis]|uniref:Uncharacterized protein n=1 Tax=Leptidea sinapis TaxID=189913 RepID=A0A5E4PYH3_9NEOP|nr:unnamed protein product [Leptidea sinapis]
MRSNNTKDLTTGGNLYWTDEALGQISVARTRGGARGGVRAVLTKVFEFRRCDTYLNKIERIRVTSQGMLAPGANRELLAEHSDHFPLLKPYGLAIDGVINCLYCCAFASDCRDGSDESAERCGHATCGAAQFACEQSRRCLPAAWRCDGARDCGPLDDTDERGCGELLLYYNITFCLIHLSIRM